MARSESRDGDLQGARGGPRPDPANRPRRRPPGGPVRPWGPHEGRLRVPERTLSILARRTRAGRASVGIVRRESHDGRSRRADPPRRRLAARRIGRVEGDTTADAMLQARDSVRAVGHGAAVPRERPFGILPRGPRRGRCGRGRPDRTSRDGPPAPDAVAGRRRSPRGRTGRIVSAIATDVVSLTLFCWMQARPGRESIHTVLMIEHASRWSGEGGPRWGMRPPI